MLLSPRKNGLASLFKEVRVFKVIFNRCRFFLETNSFCNNCAYSGKKKAHKHKLFGPVALGTPRECPQDKPGLSQGQTQVFLKVVGPKDLKNLWIV